ncbi:hypothetical protein CLAFUW4_04282 [Fulvia fulva]|uniref:Uncharacterized protein n=1 Tax=Passalora fulva TaxID=5499 RepID=A0A9Q8LG17_PASFU|nr:uncharacterized protein CLAFUR5_04247 [Fulvia fulva]KAK4627009.1 hypothetical protein CLAFUR4_04268 [Fulvia fulva]KAK4627691.1 hypothetical protein CLAFUR0_04270 [Fulvia fulva]UJO16759.1 hypothetical protein CLAFUR5_04247 [Fulvia fulva]WPV13737.1 hypothetical protein CLAFUW4_04282 [Fulvia fulva]WPV28319.1 hypothetical protein CLAFUW7_04271 [Fulvia fulva]
MAAPPAAMPPFQPPLGPQPAGPLYSANQVTLRMKEKVFSLSGDDFTVADVNETPILKVKGKVVSLSGKKTFTDLQGQELFVLSKKLLKLHPTFTAESAAGCNFEVAGKFSFGSSKSVITFANHADKAPIEMQLKGDWFDRSATIKMGDRPVAQIQRSFMNVREIFGSKQTYFVTIAPGVDLSLIAAICVCLDERENEK